MTYQATTSTGPSVAPVKATVGQGSARQPGPVALVLSRQAKAGHEQAFEEVLRRLAVAVRAQPGHLAVTTLAPRPGGAPLYTVVSHFASRAGADDWLSSPERGRLVAEADLHARGELEARYVSGLEGWLARPRQPVLAPPARWRLAVVTAIALLPLLEVISYLLFPRLAGLPVWARPAISVAVVIPLMQYVVVPVLARVARGFLYPAPFRQARGGET